MSQETLAKIIGVPEKHIVKVLTNQVAHVVWLKTNKLKRDIIKNLERSYLYGYASYNVYPDAKNKVLVVELHKEGTKIVRKERALQKYKDFKIPIGESVNGPVIHDFKSSPHLIVAGTTGSGKSMFLHNMLFHVIKYNPNVIIIPIDFKGNELTRYEKFISTIHIHNLNLKEYVVKALEAMVELMRIRYETFRKVDCKDIDSYNK